MVSKELMERVKKLNTMQPQQTTEQVLRQTLPKNDIETTKAANAEPSPAAWDNAKSLLMEVPTGLANAGTALYKTADFFIPDESVSDILGVENKVGKFFDKIYADNEMLNRQQAERRAKADKWAAKLGEYVIAPVAQALPNAAVAFMSGGTSLAGQGAATLGAAANTAGTASMVANTAKDMLSNPSFWTSFAQTVGPTYFEAKENGASELEASATAMLNAFAGSAIEVGGGIEQLPNTSMGVRQWVRSMLDEGKEEVLQGITEGLVSKAIYDSDREWASLTDSDAIFSGSRAAQEFIGGVTVGGVLGAGQIGVAKAVDAVKNYSDTVKVGNSYLKNADGRTLEQALQIGFFNAKGTDVYRAAEAIQQKAANGEAISPFAVGKMVLDSFKPAAQQARALDGHVRQSAQAFNLDEQLVDDIARVAVATGRQVEFVAPEQLQVRGVNGVSVAEGSYSEGKVRLNAAMPAERITRYLIKHELTHAIEGTKQWEQLKQIVRASYGEAAFEAAKSAVTQQYASNNQQLTPEGAVHEVVAQWVGDNLFKEGFAQAIANGDASVGNAFLRALDKIRLALGGTKNSRTAGNIAMVERLFMRALDNESNSDRREGAFSFIGKLKDGTRVYESDVDSALALEQKKELFKKRIATVFNLGAVVLNTDVKKIHVLADRFTIKKNIFGDEYATPENMDAKYRMLYDMADILKTSQYMPSKTAPEESYINPIKEPKNAAHKDVKYWYKFQNEIVLDGVGYIVTFNIRDKGKTQYEYLIEIKESGRTVNHTAVESLRQTYRASTNTIKAQNSFGVNSYNMQNGGENSQFSFGRVNGQDINVPYEDGNVESAANSQAHGNLEETAPAVSADVEQQTLEDVPYADDAVADVAKKVVDIKKEKHTKAELARADKRSDLLDRFERGEITRAEMEEALTKLDREASDETAKKYQVGNRGTAVQKEMVKSTNAEYREHVETRARERALSKECTRLRNSIQTKLDELQSKLTRPSKGRSIPREWVPYVQDLLETVQQSPAEIEERLHDLQKRMDAETDSKKYDQLRKMKEKLMARTQAVSENLQNLRNAYTQLKNDEEFKGAYQEAIAMRLNDVTEMLRGRTTKELSHAELETVLQTVYAVTKNISESQKLLCKEYEKEVHETGMLLIQESSEAASAEKGLLKFNFAKKLLNWHLTPDRLFARLGGFAKNSVWEKVGATFIEGQKRFFRTLQTFDQHFDNVIKKRKEFDKLSSTKKEDLVDVGLKDKNGDAVRMTRDMMLSLYQILSCRANRQAVIFGGIEIPDMELYYRYGMSKEAYEKGARITRSEFLDELFDLQKQLENTDDVSKQTEIYERFLAVQELANQSYDNVLKNIEKQLTTFEREYCKLTRSWFDDVSKKIINEATLEVLGFPRAVVEMYYPIHRDTDFVHTEFSSLVYNQTLENMGSLKARVKSSAPVLLTGLSAELEASSRNTAKLAGFLKPESDFRKLMNVHDRENNRSVKKALRAFGADIGHTGVDVGTYLENMVADLTVGRKFEQGWVSAFRRGAVRAVMTVNGRVALIQAAAGPTAAAEVGWKYWAKGAKHLLKKPPTDLICKWSAYGYMRNRGEGGMEEFAAARQGSNVVDRLYNAVDKKTDGWLFGWCQKMDVATVNRLWFACEENIQDTRSDLKVGTDEYYQAVGDLLDTTIRKTQSNGTVMESSDLLRNKSEIMKTVTMFKTDSIQQFNIVYEGIARYRKYAADFKAGKNGVTQADLDTAKKKLANGVTGVLIGGIMFATLLRAIANFALQNADKYRDEDGEITASSFAGAAGREMLGSMAGMVVFGDFVYEALEARLFGERYYGISDSGLETVSNLLEDISSRDLTKADTWKRFVLDLAATMGVPAKNVSNMADAVIAHVKDIKNGEFLSMNASADVSISQFYKRLYKALRDGEQERAERVKRELIGLGKTETEILAGMRTAIKKSDSTFSSIYDEMIADVSATLLYDKLTEEEKKKVQSGIAGYVADTLLYQNTDNELTDANAKAAKYAEKGVPEVDYFLAQVVKNAFFADTNQDEKVSKAEYGKALDEGQYDGKVRSLLFGLK